MVQIGTKWKFSDLSPMIIISNKLGFEDMMQDAVPFDD